MPEGDIMDDTSAVEVLYSFSRSLPKKDPAWKLIRQALNQVLQSYENQVDTSQIYHIPKRKQKS